MAQLLIFFHETVVMKLRTSRFFVRAKKITRRPDE